MPRWLWMSCVMLLLTPWAMAADKDDESKSEKPTAQIAHMKLSGSMDEGPSSDDPLAASGEPLRAKLERIAKAAKDPKVKALYLELDGIATGLFSFGKLDELHVALADFRKSGKKVYAFMEAGSLGEYLIASSADVIALPESGALEILGLRAEISFYKDLFDKLGVKADFLHMGDYKGAAEPYTRTSMSKENRAQYEMVIDDFYQNSVLAVIAKNRPAKKWTAKQVGELIDQGPFTAPEALKNGLIDQLAYADTFEASIIKATGEKAEIVRNYGKPKSDIDTSSLSGLLKLLSPPKKTKSKKPKLAVIYAVGAIESGKGGESLMGGSSIGSTTMVEAIREADADESVKAIVLRVDSPGGSALASDIIWHAIQQCKKPVIASMGDVAASGGYYISMGCKKIFAEPGTLTGSIGVVGGKFVLGGVYNKFGIQTEVITRGKNTGMLSSEAEFSESERKAFQRSMEQIYEQFLDKALAGRTKAGAKLTKEKLISLAGGRIWTGRQAKEAGLVDELGTLNDAIAEARKQAGIGADVELEIITSPKKVSFLESLLERDTALQITMQPLVGLVRQMPELRSQLQQAESLFRMRNERLWLVAPAHLNLR
ncbi:signal peptide peptidase SppA [Tuwongella immobilis]|uniref:Peptidase S49 domain-containing protein n=1 Tax=Tuwongella immobilis TaxID=692036 RepID=A0A6C2YK79_9BACT|nr:signal peptide peptidase SppA [Tuwongella immobilis]VIP01513.1 signal peptide peptidase 67k type : Signal peptide peptidase SppA, 36K type OS=Planctomyces brasiliensis (strain ATCC 49424 / DSM 5305 / JCM 21570 / NBRC 103401 / IFAM 1448) GN=Plabr_0403 PE=4 SV=1: Peptidase_S49: Peptidase_S49 [Tuwongella immobilis]VTR98631.1 signal peptide peptidase 67k type : Signal peptide peptidase SppA, 36K type OS=Planctomyces brasiliensis (strain ATCC 49424 / DSM 5305 / JCM 21570 / NBRC 103401 / IFAM 1448) 